MTLFNRFLSNDPLLGVRTDNPDFRVIEAFVGFNMYYHQDLPFAPPVDVAERAIAVTFTATPEPMTLTLSGAGLLAVGVWVRTANRRRV